MADVFAGEIGQVLRLKHDHRAEQDGPGESGRAQQQQRGSDIGIAQRRQFVGIESIIWRWRR